MSSQIKHILTVRFWSPSEETGEMELHQTSSFIGYNMEIQQLHLVLMGQLPASNLWEEAIWQAVNFSAQALSDCVVSYEFSAVRPQEEDHHG